jgi:hypothetical protein
MPLGYKLTQRNRGNRLRRGLGSFIEGLRCQRRQCAHSNKGLTCSSLASLDGTVHVAHLRGE